MGVLHQQEPTPLQRHAQARLLPAFFFLRDARSAHSKEEKRKVTQSFAQTVDGHLQNGIFHRHYILYIFFQWEELQLEPLYGQVSHICHFDGIYNLTFGL
ncbi:hypothetical protein GBA52_008998 [Prunus armeniaca]|nr:hypothetical protein GBA52_008998 [Prunus armeniaca]